MKDSRIRSLIKCLSWRVLATSTTMAIVFVSTGNLELVAAVGAADVVIKLLVYYGHERIWGRIAWGRCTVRS